MEMMEMITRLLSFESLVGAKYQFRDEFVAKHQLSRQGSAIRKDRAHA